MAPSSRLAADDHRRRTGFAHGSLAGAAAASDGSPDTARQNTYDVRVRAAAGSLAILLAMAILAGSALGAALARTDVAAAARSDGDQDKVFDDLEHTLTPGVQGRADRGDRADARRDVAHSRSRYSPRRRRFSGRRALFDRRRLRRDDDPRSSPGSGCRPAGRACRGERRYPGAKRLRTGFFWRPGRPGRRQRRRFDQDGGGELADLIAALDWVVANKDTFGIEVVNMSVSADGCSDGTDLTSQAVGRAFDAGVVVIAAAGNNGPERAASARRAPPRRR